MLIRLLHTYIGTYRVHNHHVCPTLFGYPIRRMFSGCLNADCKGCLVLCFRLAQPVLGRIGWIAFTRRLRCSFYFILFFYIFLFRTSSRCCCFNQFIKVLIHWMGVLLVSIFGFGICFSWLNSVPLMGTVHKNKSSGNGRWLFAPSPRKFTWLSNFQSSIKSVVANEA